MPEAQEPAGETGVHCMKVRRLGRGELWSRMNRMACVCYPQSLSAVTIAESGHLVPE